MKVQTVLQIAGGLVLIPLYIFLWTAIRNGNDESFSRRSAALCWLSYSIWIVYGLSKSVPDIWMVYFTAPGVALFQTAMVLGHTDGVWRGKINAVMRRSFLSTSLLIPAHYFGVFQRHQTAYLAAGFIVLIALLFMSRQRMVDNRTFANDLTQMFTGCSFFSCVFFAAYGYNIEDMWMFRLQCAGVITSAAGYFVASWTKSQKVLRPQPRTSYR